jgi:NTE family protein
VYTGGFNLLSLLRLLFGARSFYGNEPLRKMLLQELEPQKIRGDLRIGAVSLLTGEYVQFTPAEPNLVDVIMASTVMPVIWTPVDISPRYRSMVDGGVRNISPIGDVLNADPDEIVIINCSAQVAEELAEPPKSVVKIGLRTLDLLLNELFVSDLREFLMINALVKEAGGQNISLHHPSSGRSLKYFDCKIIEPEGPLNDTLDFSPPAVKAAFQAGWERARQVLGEKE